MNSYDFVLMQYNNALTRIESLESQLKEKDALLKETIGLIRELHSVHMRFNNGKDFTSPFGDICKLKDLFLAKDEVKKIMDNKGE